MIFGRGHHRAQHSDYILKQMEQLMTASQDALNTAAVTLNAAADRLAAALVPEAADDLTELTAAIARIDGLVPAPVAVLDLPAGSAPLMLDVNGNPIPAV